MKYHALFYLLLFLEVLAVEAQVVQPLWLHKLGKAEGLSNTAIYGTFQDSEGFTWIGTPSGLDRFDGRNVHHYQPDASDSTSLSGHIVHGGFFEDSRKNIWFCTEGAIQCYHRRHNNFTAYQVTDSRGLKVRSGYRPIYLERDSFLWIRTAGRAIYYFNIHSLQASPPVAHTAFDIKVFPGPAANGKLRYLFSVDGSKSKGLEVFELGAARAIQHSFTVFRGEAPDVLALNIDKVYFEHDTAVWLSATSGFYKWNSSSGQVRPYFAGDCPVAPFDSSHFVLAGRGKKLFLLDKKSGAIDSLSCRLLNSTMPSGVSSIYNLNTDPQGNVWLHIFEEGLAFANPRKVKFQSIPKFPILGGATNYTFRSMVQDNNRQIWCSTFFDGIFLLDREGRLLRHYHPDHLPSLSMRSAQANHILLDDQQILWLANDEGVSYLEMPSETFITLRDENGNLVKNAAYLFQLKGGDILASTLQHGVFRIVSEEGGRYLKQVYAPQNESDFFTTIYEDERGTIYISRRMSEITVFHLSGDNLQALFSKEIKGMANGFYESANRTSLWIATSYGLVKMNKAQLDEPHHLYTKKDGLQNNEIQSLAMGKDGNLWLGTSTGLARFDTATAQFTNFSLADGMLSRQFYSLAALCHTNGDIWFGGNNGITIVKPESVSLLKDKPILQITEIKVNDQTLPSLSGADERVTNVSAIRSLVRAYKENTLSFSFVAIDYSDPKATQLEYKMDGFEEQWVRLEKGEPGFARYSNLPHGSYTFMIRAANSDGIWQSSAKQLAVRILPPWYKSWWAVSLFILVFISALYGFYQSRVRRIRRAEAFKRKEAEYKQHTAEIETSVLRLQMNPHFIFNSMNSISSYIQQRDIDTANDYLNRFARLMRMILKLSEKPFLDLRQEIELLEQYLETEAMRFEDKIQYEFKLTDGLDPDEVILPTMILQPFIENAIWHGLAKKKGKKVISIAFEHANGQLCCSVEDNGIGRAAASANRPASRDHHSKAIEITRRRLRLLEEMEGGNTELKVVDLKGDDGRPSGTRVVICVPFL